MRSLIVNLLFSWIDLLLVIMFSFVFLLVGVFYYGIVKPVFLINFFIRGSR